MIHYGYPITYGDTLEETDNAFTSEMVLTVILDYCSNDKNKAKVRRVVIGILTMLLSPKVAAAYDNLLVPAKNRTHGVGSSPVPGEPQIILNRNRLIGTFIGKTLGYIVQGAVCYKIMKSPQSAFLLRTGLKYGLKVLDFSSKKYIRIDFKSESIFSDAIDASFFAY